MTGYRMFNTTERFGLVAIILHWVIALTVIGLFALGLYMLELSYYDPLYKVLPFVHKSVGLLLIVLLLARIVWKITTVQPNPVSGRTPFEIAAAKLVHFGLDAIILLIIFSGYLIPTAKGAGISVFGWFEVPASITSIPVQEDSAGSIHRYLAYLVVALSVLHAAAALKHHIINKDNTLRRMLGMGFVDK